MLSALIQVLVWTWAVFWTLLACFTTSVKKLVTTFLFLLVLLLFFLVLFLVVDLVEEDLVLVVFLVFFAFEPLDLPAVVFVPLDLLADRFRSKI